MIPECIELTISVFLLSPWPHGIIQGMEKEYLTTEMVDAMIRDLVRQIKSSKKAFYSVVGIAHGGLHVSRPISQALGLPHYTVEISYYDGEVRRPSPVIGKSEVERIWGSIIVDDLIDSGGTFRLFDQMFGLKGNAVAVLLCGAKASPRPDFCARIKPDKWIVFPWEVEYAD